MLLAAAIGVPASAGTINYSYAGDQVVAYGLSIKQVYDVAMHIDNSAFYGMTVNKINGYITTTDGINDFKVWMTTELALTSGENVPNICSVEVTPVEATYAGEDVYLLSLTLEEPYLYEGGDLYVGYSINVPDVATPLQKNPILLSEGYNPDGFWLHGSRNPLKWMEYSSKSGGVAVIEVEFEGDYPENSMALGSIGNVNAVVDEPFEIKVNVVNTGSEPISNFDYTYTMADETHTGSITLDTPIAANPAFTSTVTIPCEPVSTMGKYELELTVNKVNGEDNPNENKTTSRSIGVLTFAVNSVPLIEEYTGLWCGWCPRGFTAMEMLAEQFGDQIVGIALHQGDPMQVTNAFPYNVSGYPSATINRQSQVDPYYGTTQGEDYYIEVNVNDALAQIAEGAIKITGLSVENGSLKVNTESMFTDDYENANFKIGYTLVANDLSNESWGQSNYFRQYASSYQNNPDLKEWTLLGSTVYGLVFNEVAVNTVGEMGVNNSLPSEIKFGETYDYEFSLKCTDLRNVSGDILPFDLSKAFIAAYIINRNGRIVNATKAYIGEVAGVKGVSASDAFVSETVYYDLNGRKVLNPSNGVFVKMDKLSDGTFKTSKIVVK